MNKKMMKKWMALALALVMILAAAGCGDSGNTGDDTGKTTVDIIKEKGELVVGTSADYPPYEFHMMDENGKDKIVGIDILLAEAIADELGVELKLQDMSFDGLLISLAEGKYDMVIAGLTSDPERKVLFSDSYNDRDQVAIVKASDVDKYKEMSDLAGKKVGGQKGTVQADLAATIAENTTPILLQKFPDLIQSVKEGSIDAMISDKDVAEVYVQANPDLALAPMEIPYENSKVGIAFKEDNTALCEEVNKIIAKFKEDGTIEKLKAEGTALAAQEESKNAAGAAQ